jgi:hypothetical protein
VAQAVAQAEVAAEAVAEAAVEAAAGVRSEEEVAGRGCASTPKFDPFSLSATMSVASSIPATATDDRGADGNVSSADGVSGGDR